MSHEQLRPRQSLYTQIDVSPSAYPPVTPAGRGELAEQTRLLRELLAAQAAAGLMRVAWVPWRILHE